MSGPNPIPNWFDYAEYYDHMVDTASPGSWLVEVGVYHGASLLHLAHEAKAANKGLTVVGIDWGRGSAEHSDEMADLPYNNLAGPMLRTLVDGGVADDCSVILAPSLAAAKFVPDGACHMVFIDANHSYFAVLDDIRAYLPKIAPGGSIAGHDYFSFPGVRQAVHTAFGKKDYMCRYAHSCWEYKL